MEREHENGRRQMRIVFLLLSLQKRRGIPLRESEKKRKQQKRQGARRRSESVTEKKSFGRRKMKENHIFFREYRAEARQKNIGTKEKVAVLTACGNVKREKCLFPTFGRRFFYKIK